jgi:Tol biopolymer transport system component
MTREEWQRVKSISAAALEHSDDDRFAFVARACDGDEALAREVRSLLSFAARASHRFETPVFWSPGIAQALVDAARRPSVSPGAQVGPYQVIDAIGRGGMGEVYRARDTRLNRDVALKVLPGLFAGEPDRRARFEREARVLAALNHPNIAAIYGLEDADGRPALVLELVEGPTLAERLSGGPLPLHEALTNALQIAGGLEAAHHKGIVHRDLKPANISFTPQGVVKVLDFGLATVAGDRRSPGVDGSPAGAIDVTQAGLIVGTAAYMSPEAARGMAVDERADVWAFGCVLFEMLAGWRPFAGASVPDTIAAILEREPPWAALPDATPSRVIGVLRRCLEKDPMRRLRRIAEARVEIEDALARLTRPRRIWSRAGVAAALIAAFSVYAWLRPEHGPATGRTDWVQLTNMDSVAHPALSADGRTLAFTRGSGTFTTSGQIYIKPLPAGEPVRLTEDTRIKMDPVFSPDGSQVAYTVVEGQSWDTWIVSLRGAEPRRWLRNASGLRWIGPDRLLFAEKRSGIHMGIVAARESRTEGRDVYLPRHLLGMAHRSYPSPDHKSALVVEMDERGVWLPCRLVPMDGGSAGWAVGPPRARCTAAAWSPDGSWMYFSANAGDGFHLWSQRFPDGAPRQMTSGPTEEEGIAVAPDGKSLVTAVGLQQRSVWVRDPAGERQISLEGYAFWPLLSTDARKVCFRVARTATSGQTPTELWMVELSSGLTKRVLGEHLVTGYDVSRDDRIVAAVTETDGTSRLWVAWLDGREPPRPIPAAEGDNPRFGADGDIFFRASDGSSMSIFRIRPDGTGRRKVFEDAATVFGSVSPDGRWLSTMGGASVVTVRSTVDGTTVPVLSAHTGRIRWSADGTRVYISVQEGEASSFARGRTYVLPLPKGSVLPNLPPGGFRSEAELAAVPGVEVLPYGDVGSGPSPTAYAFSRTTATRNLYRIPLP